MWYSLFGNRPFVPNCLAIKTGFLSTWRSCSLAHDSIVRIVFKAMKGTRSEVDEYLEDRDVPFVQIFQTVSRRENESFCCMPLRMVTFFPSLWFLWGALLAWACFTRPVQMRECPLFLLDWDQEDLWDTRVEEAADQGSSHRGLRLSHDAHVGSLLLRGKRCGAGRKSEPVKSPKENSEEVIDISRTAT